MSGLDQTAEAYLRTGGQEVSYADGETIIHRGQAGKAFYLVTAGRPEVLLATEDGHRLPLTRLLPGATFGEMSLLTDQPVSADVVARGAVTVLEYPGELFQTALGECTSLRNHILGGFCASLRKTNTKAWGFYQRGQALEALMHAEGRTGEIIAEAAPMRRVRERIAELARTARVIIMISGQPGTGKLFAARKIHETLCDTDDADARLIIVDCSRLGPSQAARLLFGPADDRQFEERPDSLTALPMPGALDLADGGTMVLQHIDSLDAAAQELLCRYLAARSDDSRTVEPCVRVIATTSKDLVNLARTGRFSADLAERLSVNVLEMPTLLSRRRDILPLAGLFLRERDDRLEDGEHHFNTSAEHALVSAQYRHGNATELRDAVEFSALFAEGPEIGSEHIFTGPVHEEPRLEYDLARNVSVRWLLDKGGLTLLRIATLAVFGAVAVLCLAAGDTPAGRVANGLVWGLWWPALMVLFLFVGRTWCMICPISLAGRLARHVASLGRTPPQWLKKHTAWVMLALFVLIVWVEHVFQMTRQPFATGILLVVLMGAAALADVRASILRQSRPSHWPCSCWRPDR